MPAEAPLSPPEHQDFYAQLLADALQRQNDTNRDGFDRLETAQAKTAQVILDGNHAMQTNFRIITILAILGLIGALGVNFTGQWGDAAVSVTPTAVAAEAEHGSR